MTTFEKIITYATAAAAGVGVGTLITKAILEKKTDSTIKEKIDKTLGEEVTTEILKKVAVESAGKITKEQIDDAVRKSSDTIVESRCREVIRDVVKDLAAEQIKPKVEAAITDYDVKKGLLQAVSEAAENYVNSKGDGIIRTAVSKSVESKLSTISSIARTAAAFKGF